MTELTVKGFSVVFAGNSLRLVCFRYKILDLTFLFPLWPARNIENSPVKTNHRILRPNIWFQEIPLIIGCKDLEKFTDSSYQMYTGWRDNDYSSYKGDNFFFFFLKEIISKLILWQPPLRAPVLFLEGNKVSNLIPELSTKGERLEQNFSLFFFCFSFFGLTHSMQKFQGHG